MRRAGWTFAGIIILLLAAFALKGTLIALPEPPAAPAPGEFDESRARERLARILDGIGPHTVDSDAGDVVRGRIAEELRAIGLTPRETDSFTCHGREASRAVACGRVRNLVATIGPDEGNHLLVVTHIDSTFVGPGAADAGIGIASMLEAASLLRDRPLSRPITFLFDDGEESGLIGARAFLDSDPLASRVDALINLEARGVSGPAIMFETSRPNGAAIAAFVAGAGRPVANSLSTDFYRLIPNSTDVAVFESRPWTILNFAIIGDETRYHTDGDTLGALDRRSLHHMGSQLLGIAGAMAGPDAPHGSGAIIYTDIAGRYLVTVPQLAGLVILGLFVILFGIMTWLRGAMGRPVAAALIAIIGAPLIAFAATFLMGLIRGGDYWRAFPLAAHMAVYASTILTCVLALAWLGRRNDRDQLRIAAWFVFLVAGALLCILAPGAAIFVIGPALLVGLGALAGQRAPWAERLFAILACLVAFVTFGEALALMELLLVDGPLTLLALPAALVALPILVEALPGDRQQPLRPLLIGLGALVAAGWIAVGLLPRASADRQQLVTLEYVRDTAAGQSWWAVSNKSVRLPAGFAGQESWRLREFPYSGRERWAAPAPSLPIEAPVIERVAERREGSGRRITFRVRANGAHSWLIRAPAAAPISAAGSGPSMHAFGPGTARYSIRCTGRTCDGQPFDIVVGGDQPVELSIVGIRSGLPAEAAPLVAARPAHARAQYTPDSTYTMASFRL